MPKEESQKPSFKIAYLEELLKEEGYRPYVDEDGDLIFKAESKNLLIPADRGDEEFLRIALPNFWSIDSELERLMTDKAASEVNRTVKAVKVFPVEDNIWASVEIFASPIQSVHDVLPRYIQVLLLALDEFRQQMQKLRAQQDCEIENEFDE